MTPTAPSALAPLRRPTRLHDALLEELGPRIVSGTILPGECLPHELALAQVFRVSRTVLRSALQLLGGKGLIQIRHGSSTAVLPPGRWNLLDADVLRWISQCAVPLGAAHPGWEGTALREQTIRFAAAIHALASELHGNPLYISLTRTLCAAGYGDSVNETAPPAGEDRS